MSENLENRLSNVEKIEELILDKLTKMEENMQNIPFSFNNCTFSGTFYAPLISDFFYKSLDMSQNKDNSTKSKPKTQEFNIDGNVGQFGNESNAFDGNVGQLANASNGFAATAEASVAKDSATAGFAKDSATAGFAKDSAKLNSTSHLSGSASSHHTTDNAKSAVGDNNQLADTINVNTVGDSTDDSILVPEQESYEEIMLELPETNLATNKEYFTGRLLNHFINNPRNAYLANIVSKFVGPKIFSKRLEKIQEFGQTFIKKIPLDDIFKICQPALLHLLDDYRTRELIFRFLNNDCNFDKLKEIVTVSEKEHFGKYFEILQKVYYSMTITKKVKDIFCKLEKVTKDNYASRINEDVIRLFFFILSDSLNGYNNTALFLSRDTMQTVFKDDAKYSVEFKQFEYPSQKINELLLESPDYKDKFTDVEDICDNTEKDKYESIYYKLFGLIGDDDGDDEYVAHKDLDARIPKEEKIIDSINQRLDIDCVELLNCAEPIEIVVRAWFLAAFMYHTIENNGTSCNQVYTFTTNSNNFTDVNIDKEFSIAKLGITGGKSSKRYQHKDSQEEDREKKPDKQNITTANDIMLQDIQASPSSKDIIEKAVKNKYESDISSTLTGTFSETTLFCNANENVRKAFNYSSKEAIYSDGRRHYLTPLTLQSEVAKTAATIMINDTTCNNYDKIVEYIKSDTTVNMFVESNSSFILDNDATQLLTVELTEDNTFEFNTIKLNDAKALDEVMYNHKRQIYEAFMINDSTNVEIIQQLFTNGLAVIPESTTKQVEIKILTLLLTYYIGFKHIDYLIHHIPEQSTQPQSKIHTQKSKSSRCNANK